MVFGVPRTFGWRVVLLVGVMLVGLPAGSAVAATTVGQTGTPLTGIHYNSPQELVMASDVMPTAGVVTSLNTQSSPCDAGTGTYNLQVLRPVGPNEYKVLGDTGNQTDPCDSNLHSYPVNIVVQAGDLLGAYATTWEAVLTTSSGTDNFAFIPEPAVGATISTTNTSPDTVDESATLLTNPDLAAQLVTDSSAKGPGNALANKASALQAAPTCAGITDYLGLVKAQTGKKLTTTQASMLTNDANKLAAVLGC